VGGVGFLAKYDGLNFTDLTPNLNAALGRRYDLNYTECCNAVNTIAWDGDSWQIGGGAAVATPEPLGAWAASYDGVSFTNLTPLIPPYIANAAHGSSVLSIYSAKGSEFFGGYANGRGFFFSLTNSAVTDLSAMINDTSTIVNWVGGMPATTHEALTMNPVTVFGSYMLAAIIIVTVSATALAVRHRKNNRRRR